MATYTPNYNLSKPEANDNFDAFRASYGDNMDKIDQNMGGGGGGGGHTIVDPDGTDMPQENKLQFTGAVNVSDDAVNGQTVVDIEGGGNYYLNTIYSTEEKKIGYWTDSKPLYQKTIVNHSTDVSGAGILIDVSSLNIDSCVSIEGVCDRNVAGVGTLIYNMNSYEDSGLRTYISYSKFNQKIQYTIRFYNGETTSTQIITLRYTKTTDTPETNPQTGGVIYLPTIYSEEEREVGVWTDGKPLYQKTIPFTTDSGSNITNYTHGIANIDTVVSYSGVIVRADGVSIDINDSRWQGNADDLVGCLAGKTFISVFINYSSYRNLPIYVTILYTKTTDTAGSGTWTPSGANAVHYSFTEHIVGTWFGETLWEKTIAYVSSAGQADTDKVIDTSIRHGTNCYVVDLQGIQTYGYLRNNGTSPTPNATSDPEPLSQGTLYLPYYGGSSMNSAHIYLYSDGIHFKKRGGSANANSIILTVRYVKI